MAFKKTPEQTKQEVFVFNLNEDGELEQYTAILNNDKMTIIRDEHHYDRHGQSIITIWVEVKKDG